MDYEVLVDIGSSGLSIEYFYADALIDADLGDGFYAAAIIGDVTGIKRYTLNWDNAHRDKSLVQARTYNNALIGSPVPRWLYMKDFFYRRMSEGNGPFWITEPNAPLPANRINVLCRMILQTLKQTQNKQNPLLWSYSIQCQQIRGAAAQSPP